MVYFSSNAGNEPTVQVQGRRDLSWIFDENDPSYKEFTRHCDASDLKHRLQRLTKSYGESNHTNPIQSMKLSQTYVESDRKYQEYAEALNSTCNEEDLQYPEEENALNTSYNEDLQYPEEEIELRTTYPDDDRKFSEQTEAWRPNYLDDILQYLEHTRELGEPYNENTYKYLQNASRFRERAFYEADPRGFSPPDRIYQVKQPKHLQPDRVQSTGNLRKTSWQQQPPSADPRCWPPVADSSASCDARGRPAEPREDARWRHDVQDAGAREGLNQRNNGLFNDFGNARADVCKSKELFALDLETTTSACPKKDNFIPGERRNQSYSTTRPQSISSSQRLSYSPRPRCVQPSISRQSTPSALQGALDPAAKRRLYMRYSYIPAWVLLARPHETFFARVLEYYFRFNAWPEFDKLPEHFKNLCAQQSIGPNHAKKLPGFAPVWLFELKKMDGRYFRAAVDHFFEHKLLPNWSRLPLQFVQKFEELGINQRLYYA